MMPAMDETPFRITILFTNGEAREFPIYINAAIESAKRAARWTKAPFSSAIIPELEKERDILFGATVRVYAHIALSPEGTYYLTDDEGNEWAVIASHVMAVSLDDPIATKGKRPRQMGFDRERREGAEN